MRKRKNKLLFAGKMDRTQDHYVKSNKSDPERKALHGFSSMWKLRNFYRCESWGWGCIYDGRRPEGGGKREELV